MKATPHSVRVYPEGGEIVLELIVGDQEVIGRANLSPERARSLGAYLGVIADEAERR